MNHSWHWSEDTEHAYLTTSLLSRWPHGFFTRQSWPHLPDALSQQLGSDRPAYRAKQVHGNHVLTPPELPAVSDESEELPAADAVMSLAPHQAVWVCTADCTPVLIADTQTGQVAAVHAGWRGTALSIVPTTIAKMQAQGSELSHLRIAMGPAIAGTVYQVTTHVAAEVGRSLVGLDTEIASLDDQDLIAYLQDLPEPPVLPDPQEGRVRLDVRRINALQLTALGIPDEHVAIAPHCTFQEPERFFSYRRTREKKVQWSGIVSC
ncbi:peptidoglycan editing factor PgeF [Leptolyngbya iicbica]|uniref:Purine nucleoside phosphorylase n=2 Tax=Cyanophyceae TaxID=3028117 RepID=A0A4Q7E5Z7_9CYAN|nr:peptidoglycan editing factor PgeF [Leptolyngbya sp. LK]RZM77390.1 peptidoglycan editing factor PgeF [Leptolyngbya sp. LK]